jgi:hypothetical protein
MGNPARSQAERLRRQRDRDAAFGHYGRVCARCGSARQLQIDHINDDGAAHRASDPAASTLYRWLRLHGYPPGFQTLCAPCNRAKSDAARGLGAAERELRADPRRSDALIALAARCTAQHAGRVRARLERAGAIAHVPVDKRLARARTWRPRPPRAAIEAGASSTAEVMALAGVSYGTAWAALARAGSRPRLADAAAATDALRVIRHQDRKPVSHPVLNGRPPSGFYSPPDAIELACPACTLEYSSGGWQHSRSCPLRASARAR